MTQYDLSNEHLAKIASLKEPRTFVFPTGLSVMSRGDYGQKAYEFRVHPPMLVFEPRFRRGKFSAFDGPAAAIAEKMLKHGETPPAGMVVEVESQTFGAAERALVLLPHPEHVDELKPWFTFSIPSSVATMRFQLYEGMMTVQLNQSDIRQGGARYPEPKPQLTDRQKGWFKKDHVTLWLAAMHYAKENGLKLRVLDPELIRLNLPDFLRRLSDETMKNRYERSLDTAAEIFGAKVSKEGRFWRVGLG